MGGTNRIDYEVADFCGESPGFVRKDMRNRAFSVTMAVHQDTWKTQLIDGSELFGSSGRVRLFSDAVWHWGST
jgi:hypothetical protein